jgi:histidinol phosphatase-like PHP family hydrolase
MAVSDLVTETSRIGILDFGLTDHIHTPYNLPDIRCSRQEFIVSNPSPRFHFGVEVSCVSVWEIEEILKGSHEKPVYGLRSGGPQNGALAIGITEEDIATYGIEYVVGGTHWPMYIPLERDEVIRDYHRQNMFLATHPLVTIVAHPWWWMGYWQDSGGNFSSKPWFDDFNVIPMPMHEEFAAAVKENGKMVEINISAILLNPHYPKRFVRQYLDYLSDLKSRGVRLCIGSDCHNDHYTKINFRKVEIMLGIAGIEECDLWRLPPRTWTVNGGRES